MSLIASNYEVTKNGGLTWVSLTESDYDAQGRIRWLFGDIDAAPGTLGIRPKGSTSPDDITWNKTAVTKKVIDPVVWVEETHSYNATTKDITVTFTLKAETNTAGISVSARRTTETGGTALETWSMPAGTTTYAKPAFVYNVNNLSSDAVISLSLESGTGYRMSDTEAQPSQVAIVVADVIADAPVVSSSGGFIRDGSYADSVQAVTTGYAIKNSGSAGFSRKALLAVNTGAVNGPVTLEFTIANNGSIVAEIFDIFLAPAFDSATATWNSVDLSNAPLLASHSHDPALGSTVTVILPNVVTSDMLYLAVWCRNNAASTEVYMAPYGSATPPVVTLGGDPYADMLKSWEEGIVGDADSNPNNPTDDYNAWVNLLSKAASLGKSIHHPSHLVSGLRSTLTVSQSGIGIYGDGGFADITVPKNANPDYTSTLTNRLIINWTGANAHGSFYIDGRFDNSTFGRWWRGWGNGVSCCKLMTAFGDNFKASVFAKNSGGIGCQWQVKNADIAKIRGYNNAYETYEFRGGKGSNESQLIKIGEIIDRKDSTDARACRKSGAVTTAATDSDGVIAYHNNVQVGVANLDNCAFLAESGDGVGSADSSARIRNISFKTLKIVSRSLENLTGGTTSSAPNTGKMENCGIINIETLDLSHTQNSGQMSWFDASKELNITNQLILDSYCFRAAEVITRINKVVFNAKSATQPLNEAIIRTTDKGCRVEITELLFNDNGFTRSYSTSDAFFNTKGHNQTTGKTIIVIGKLTRTGGSPYLMKQNYGDTAEIHILSGGLNGWLKGPNAIVRDGNGNLL